MTITPYSQIGGQALWTFQSPQGSITSGVQIGNPQGLENLPSDAQALLRVNP